MSEDFKHYPVRVNIMTYKGDQNILPYCVRSILKVFEKHDTKIYIMDDSNNPMNDEFVDEVANISSSVIYERTAFERNRNLNGKVCCVNMIQKFLEHSVEGALNLKVDPDTLIAHKRIFDEFYHNKNTAYASCSRPGCYFSGVCYMFRTEIIERALKIIDTFPIPEKTGPEDFCIGVAMCAASLPKLATLVNAWNYKSDEGVVCGWNYNCPNDEKHIDLYYKKFQFVSFGNWFKYKNLTLNDRIKPAKMFCEMIEKNKDIPGVTDKAIGLWL